MPPYLRKLKEELENFKSQPKKIILKNLINCLVIRRLAVNKIGLRLKIPSDSGILYPF